MVMYESERVGIYNISTLDKIGELVLPDSQIPDSMHYDAVIFIFLPLLHPTILPSFHATHKIL
jgi:hypothetical protein